MKTGILALLPLLVAACGGSDSPYEEAVARADKKEAEARALAVASPCADVSQCAYLPLLSPRVPCPYWSYKAYSLVSPTSGAASAAAAEHHALVEEALRVAPNTGISCIPEGPVPPPLTCTANACGP